MSIISNVYAYGSYVCIMYMKKNEIDEYAGVYVYL